MSIKEIKKVCKHRYDKKTFINVFITFKLDYCNTLYYSLPISLTNNLQKVQNTAAHLITGNTKYNHITPISKFAKLLRELLHIMRW